MDGVIRLVAAVAAALVVSAPSPIGTWKLDSKPWHYQWVSLGGGTYGEISLTAHKQAQGCTVGSGTLVYKYHPIAGGLYREDQFTWRDNCTTYWEKNHDTVKVVATATTMKAYCNAPYTKVCWSYRRLGDTTAPVVQALISDGKVGGATELRYTVSDASGKTWEALTLYKNGAAARRYRTKLGPALAGHVYDFHLDGTPASFRGTFRFCVQSHDAAGNTSKQSCSRVTIK